MAWMERAYESRDSGLTTTLTDLTVGELQDDPRYWDILRRMGLDKYADRWPWTRRP